MCDLFWVSPGNQGDLSDVVRASLHHHLPAAADYPQPEEEHHQTSSPPLVEGDGSSGGGGMVVVSNGDHDQLGVMGGGGGMVVVSNGDHDQLGMMGGGGGDTTGPSSGQLRAVLHHPPPSATTYPQPPGLIIRHMSTPTPMLGLGGAVAVEREGGVVAALPEIILGDHLQHMPMVDPRTHLPPIKRRKSQTRKVVCIPAPTAAGGRSSTSGGEVVPSDLWAWRKYGQKPIKGSPYPRGYYRCSSSKGCPARKQVERSRTDPTMLVITYTSDHNHPWPTQRNALAGSTRPSSSSSATAAAAKNISSFAAAGPGAVYRNTNDGGATAAHHQLKQEVLDSADDLGLFADMDALNIFSSSTSKINREDGTKEQLLDPFSSSFLDYWASFGEADM